MEPYLALQTHRDDIRRIDAFVAPAMPVFCFAPRDDTEDSDRDLLIDQTPDTMPLDIGAMRYELRKLLGVPVDVLTPKALPDKDNTIKERSAWQAYSPCGFKT